MWNECNTGSEKDGKIDTIDSRLQSHRTCHPNLRLIYLIFTKDAKYIEETETPEETIQTYNKNVHREESLDTLYNQIQIPLLLSILYFIFQLPIVKNTLFKYLPVLFNIDGNINLSGLITMSALFGASYYIISNTMTTISSI